MHAEGKEKKETEKETRNKKVEGGWRREEGRDRMENGWSTKYQVGKGEGVYRGEEAKWISREARKQDRDESKQKARKKPRAGPSLTGFSGGFGWLGLVWALH